MRFYRQAVIVLLSLIWVITAQLFMMTTRVMAADGALPEQLVIEGNYCIAHGGVGLFFGGVQSFQVNVEGTPLYAYAYWSGRYEEGQNGDNRVRWTFNNDGGRPVIAEETNVAYAGFRRNGIDVFYYTYRSANLVSQLPNTSLIDVKVNNLNTPEAHGAGLLVISEGPNCPYSRVQLNFGLDGFFWNFPPDAGPDTQVTCVDFPPATVDRAMDMQMFVGGVEHTMDRADRIWYATGSGAKPTDLVSMNDPANVLAGPVPPSILPPPGYPLNGSNGDWDDYATSITIPAGATYACFQIESIDRPDRTYPNGTSGVWVELMTQLIYEPGVELLKLTNGNDAKTPSASDVPTIAAGDPVTWTYLLTNTGQVTFTTTDILLNDDVEGAITNRIGDKVGNDDDLFAPGETWQYQLTGTALELSTNTAEYIVDGCGAATTAGFIRNTYANRATAQVDDLTVDDTSHYCNPAVPGIELLKLTNGNDAKNADDVDVPEIQPGALVTWTYLVTNTGQVTFDFTEVQLTDSVEGVIGDRIADGVGNNDDQLEPGETWRYQRVGMALTLSSATGNFIVTGCVNAPSGALARNTYLNSALVQVDALTATDTSHYCNPLVPGLAVLKLTNGFDAKTPDAPDVPMIIPGGVVTWTYLLTNTGQVPFAAADLSLLDSVEGAVGTRLADRVGNGDDNLEPGETWQYQQLGTALTLSNQSGNYIVNGCGGISTGSRTRATYANNVIAQGTAMETTLAVTDTSHYCNPLSTATVGNRVWGDINPGGVTPGDVEQGDGIQNGDPREEGIDGIIVELYNSEDELISTTVTSDGGIYLFTDLAPGDYYLVFINPLDAGIWTVPNQGSDDAVDSDVEAEVTDPRGDAERTELFTLEPGEVNLDWDAGLIGLSGAGSAAVGNFVWNDQNRNGLQDGGDEVGIANVTVRLYQTDGTLVQTTTTNDQGIYNFLAVNPGSYYIEFDLPTNFQISPINSGSNDEIDSDFDPVLQRTAVFTVPSFTTDLRWDAGIYRPTNLGAEEEPQQNRLFLPLVLR